MIKFAASALLVLLLSSIPGCSSTAPSAASQVERAEQYIESLNELSITLHEFPELSSKIGEEELAKLDAAIELAFLVLEAVKDGEKILEHKDWIKVINLALRIQSLIEELKS